MNPNCGKILVVDDDAGFRSALCHLLRASGFQPVELETPRDALKIVAEINPDLILLDLHMPGVNGDKLLQKIRDCGLDVPVIIISGQVEIEHLNTLRSHGVEHILVKPVNKSILIEKIRSSMLLAG
jgi:DNA-binding response OmpR family regulator